MRGTRCCGVSLWVLTLWASCDALVRSPAGAGVRCGPVFSTAAPSACTTVEVELGDRSYPIYIGDGLLTSSPEEAAGYLQPHVGGSQVLVVTNEVLERHGYLAATVAALRHGPRGEALRVETFVLPDNEDEPSEATKTLENLGAITDYAILKALDSKCTFVALGGGVIGDMVGFAAACYVRGVNFIQIPTTLMAMVDSSVGGKTAVNSKGAKNMVGAFYQPVAVGAGKMGRFDVASTWVFSTQRS